MTRKLYRINVVGRPPVYKTTKKEVEAWCRRNPGECQSWEEVDVIEEFDKLHEEVERLDRIVRRHATVLREHGADV